MAPPNSFGAVRLLVRIGVPGAVVVALVERFGTGPFLRAVERITFDSLGAALVATAATTVCSAWRWTWIARRLDLCLEVRSAVPAYYRSQFLNLVLPVGVLGDVHRALRHGDDQGARGRAFRAVAWDRVIGQVGLVGLTLVAVLGLPSVLRGSVASLTLTVLGVGGLTALTLAGARRRGRPQVAGRATAAVIADLRRLFAGGGPWLPVLLSVAAAAGHLVVLLVALRTAHVDLSLLQAVPLLLVVLVASSLPTNIAGWGPREGVAAWVFSTGGFGAANGITVAAAYGILTLVGSSPGVLVLTLDVLPRRIGVGSP